VAGATYGPALGEVEVYEAEPWKSVGIKINKTGLVGWWKMDGDWNDASIVGNHAASYGATFSNNAKIGPFAGSFNGLNNYLEVANSATLNPSNITVEVWAKSNTSTWNSYGFFVSKRDAYILHPYVGSKRISFAIYADGSWSEVTYDDPNLDITLWHHYVGTFDGTSLNIYVDGVKSSVAYSGAINTSDTGSMYVGWDDGQPGRFFNGYLDDIRIYNRAKNIPAIPGDCDASGSVSIDEVQSTINMYLGLKAVSACVDSDNSNSVSIDEVQKVINGYLGL